MMVGYLFAVVVLLVVNPTLGAMPCSPLFCNYVDCEDEAVIRSQCQDGRIQPGGSVCGCCPICIHFLDEGERCRERLQRPGPYVTTRECREGLFCNKYGLCQKTCTSLADDVTNDQQLMVGQFVPACTDDGLYQAVQCRGASCFCVNEEGETLFSPSRRIYGDHIARSHRMSCGCAREENSAHPARDTAFNCARNGNYRHSPQKIPI